MKASFGTLPSVVRASAQRLGLTIIKSAQVSPGWEGDLWVSPDDHYPTHVSGTPHTIMSLIGDMALNRQDHLLTVTQ